MAETELELDIKWKRNLNAKMKNPMSQVNSKTEFDWQI
jgi:hypothetical protein